MHLLSITARNYRIHKEVTVELDRSRTLIGGPNESGKSTLIEAAHRALFLKSKVTGEAQKSMISDVHGGNPEVEVQFQVNGKTYRISKQFSGANGTSILSVDGGKTWQGEEAEMQLSQLLGVEVVSGGRGILERSELLWSHLWVWQGKGGENPTSYATHQKESLLDRLKEKGGAAAIESQSDREVANHFTDLDKSIFTKTGKPKTDSELSIAIQMHEAAQDELIRAEEAMERLEKAIRIYAHAERTIKEKENELNKFDEELKKISGKLEEANDLLQQQALVKRDVDQAGKELKALEKADRDIQSLGRKVKKLGKDLKPKEEETKRLQKKAADGKEHSIQADKAHRQLEQDFRARRRIVELAKAWVNYFERGKQFEQLKARASKIATLKEHLENLQTSLNQLPLVDAKKLKSIQAEAGSLSKSEAALNAMAARIELIASEAAVFVDGRPVEAGQTKMIEDDVEVEAGSTRLKIYPGGGTGLVAARKQVGDQQSKLQASLDEAGVETVDMAVLTFEKRCGIEREIKDTKSELKAHAAESVDEELSDARIEHESSRAEVERRKTKAPDFADPQSVEAVKSELESAEKDLAELEMQEVKLRAERDAASEAREKAAEALVEHQQSLEEARSELHTHKARLETLQEGHGEDSARKEQLSRLKTKHRKAKDVLRKSEEALEKLQPDVLEGDKERLERAMGESRHNLSKAEQDRAVAKNTLASDGNSNPEETLALAKAKADLAKNRLTSVERKAKAIRLLKDLFADEQRSLSRQFTGPLAETITGYLQQLFGADAIANVALTDGEFEELALHRSSGTYDFQSLSGGTREQVAAAFRLAMAEILAEDHEGSLPVVFDDAFTNSDPDRIQTLQRMLDLAARQGLQVILLTCDPNDYGSLGAKTVLL